MTATSGVTETGAGPGRVRRAFLATAACYALIAFEFFYMATPFAAYFYAAYRPGLTVLSENSTLSILGRTFLPHIAVGTNNPVLDAHNIIGAILASTGFAGFCVGAVQVYYYKLFRKGVVLGGVYNVVRHPQYTCLAVSSFGLLLLWPRYVVLLAYVAMLFAYYFLARVEERECVARFGQPYREYLRRTRAFLPFGPPKPWSRLRLRLPTGRLARAGAVLGAYALVATVATAVAMALNQAALSSLCARYTPGAVYLSVDRISADRLSRLAAIADADPRTRAVVDGAGPGASFINYVLPAEWNISETLMRSQPGVERLFGSGYRSSEYRVVYTQARLRRPARGRDILTSVASRRPLLEVVVDLNGSGQVVEVLPPDPDYRYAGVPVPVY